MKARKRRLVTMVSALFVAVLALASEPAKANRPASTGSCPATRCVPHCDESYCSGSNCKAICLKAACADDQDAVACS